MENLLKQLMLGKALLFIVVLGLGGSFQTGLHLTLISSPTPFIKSYINSSWTQRYGQAPGENTVTFIWSMVTSIYALGALIGAISVQWITNQMGRKRAMIWNNSINVIGLAIMISSKFTNYFEMILLSRFLFGFTSGLAGNIHVLYLGDCSPKRIRGIITLTVAIFLAGGKLMGQVMGLSEILGREELWNLLLCVPSVFFSIIQMIALPFFPEAPRYLLIEKGNMEGCKKALQYLWGPGDYKLEIEEMLVEQSALKGERSKTPMELLRDRSMRWQVLCTFAINGGVQFCGIAAFSVFTFSIFQEAGIPVDKIRYVTLGLGISEIVTNITCGLMIERVGRRVLLWTGFGAMGIIMALLTVTLELKDYSFWMPYSTVGLIFLFVIFYGAGPAGVLNSICHEIFMQTYRSAAFVFIGILQWGGFSVLGFTFPFLLATLKSFSFLCFSCVCLTASLFFYLILPETKGKSPMEISEDFKNIRVCGSSTKEMCLETRL
ncbi:solute carrier family 2, facilitated glucose transporter member 9-like [Hoplias malabaricus]|uniref:solute carrier family 2, facilitated glucose transporter member 9-like n=1 Tax=Hoplias malabaricus TaxID=27720 RepID=UPI0034638311